MKPAGHLQIERLMLERWIPEQYAENGVRRRAPARRIPR